MSLSIYESSVPVFIRTLANLKAILEKGAAHAQAKKIEDMVFLNARLYPDMFPLASQVHIATDQARAGAARLAGGEPPSYEDDEKTFAELIARVDRTIDFLKTLKSEQFEGAESRTITRPLRGQPKAFTGINYLWQLAIPNVYFHTVTAYAILRHNGVELGKFDYLGDLD